MPRNRWQLGKITGTESYDFVVCRICGDRRRVISGRHLSKHDTDRATYMEQYELNHDELIAKVFRVIQSSRRSYRPNNRSEWITAIRKIHKHGESIFAGDLQRARNHKYLYDQGVWLFGDWDNALKAAGFDPEKMRNLTFWDKTRITEELKRLHQQKLPLYPHYVMKNHAALFSVAVRQYGSWEKALSAAGIRQVQTRNPLYLLRRLEEAMDTGEEASKTLRSEIDYYFGSLTTAKRALKTDKRFLSRWTKRKIIKLIAQRHRSGETLTDSAGRREFSPLFAAAGKYFGSWGNALHAAGIDPNLYFVQNKWKAGRSRPQRRLDRGAIYGRRNKIR